MSQTLSNPMLCMCQETIRPAWVMNLTRHTLQRQHRLEEMRHTPDFWCMFYDVLCCFRDFEHGLPSFFLFFSMTKRFRLPRLGLGLLVPGKDRPAGLGARARWSSKQQLLWDPVRRWIFWVKTWQLLWEAIEISRSAS